MTSEEYASSHSLLSHDWEEQTLVSNEKYTSYNSTSTRGSGTECLDEPEVRIVPQSVDSEFSECPTCQTSYFGDVSGIATFLHCPIGQHAADRVHETPCQECPKVMRWWTVCLDSLATSIDLCTYSEYEFPCFGFRASHGGHGFLSGFADSDDSMTEHALKSEDRLMDDCDAHEPDLALPLQGYRSGDFAQPGKSARLEVPCVADQEDARKSGTMGGTL